MCMCINQKLVNCRRTVNHDFDLDQGVLMECQLCIDQVSMECQSRVNQGYQWSECDIESLALNIQGQRNSFYFYLKIFLSPLLII